MECCGRSGAEKSVRKTKEKAKFVATQIVSSHLFAFVDVIPVAAPRKATNT